VKGADTTFWKAIAGTLSVSGSSLLFNADTDASYIQHKFGHYVFSVNVPVKPTAGDARKFGLINAANPTKGSVYFETTGTTFQAVSYDNFGNTKATSITWNDTDWSAHAILFEILWEQDHIVFIVNGSVVATHVNSPAGNYGATSTNQVGTIPQVLYIHNGNADNMLVAYVEVRNAMVII
jgi:hypothetical protein